MINGYAQSKGETADDDPALSRGSTDNYAKPTMLLVVWSTVLGLSSTNIKKSRITVWGDAKNHIDEVGSTNLKII
jgi:hypothetical protein